MHSTGWQRPAAQQAAGRSLERIEAAHGPALRERRAQWGNPQWLDEAIDRCYAEP